MKSGWVVGLDEASVREMRVNGLPAARGTASADGWRFDITVVRVDGQIYRILTAAPLSNGALAAVAGGVAESFRRMSTAERAGIRPLRIRVVEVKAGDTVGSLAARMQGTDRKLSLFRLLNALPAGATLSAGDRVKLVTE
jgi:predicted Zn-dependent protease